MGCGKTTLGKRLAKNLKRDFIDLDQYIEISERCSIREIFSSKGESYFREIEGKYLRKVIKVRKGLVIALGGGTICTGENLGLVTAHGTLCYIKLPATELVKRIGNKSGNRPLLRDLKGNKLLVHIRNLLRKRKPYYESAPVIVNGLKLDASELRDALNDVL
jgi:shikimate kinase